MIWTDDRSACVIAAVGLKTRDLASLSEEDGCDWNDENAFLTCRLSEIDARDGAWKIISNAQAKGAATSQRVKLIQQALRTAVYNLGDPSDRESLLYRISLLHGNGDPLLGAPAITSYATTLSNLSRDLSILRRREEVRAEAAARRGKANTGQSERLALSAEEERLRSLGYIYFLLWNRSPAPNDSDTSDGGPFVRFLQALDVEGGRPPVTKAAWKKRWARMIDRIGAHDAVQSWEAGPRSPVWDSGPEDI